MTKAFILILSGLILQGCSQEHLIMMKNLKNIKFITFNDILEESGLLGKKNKPANPTNQANNEITSENNVKSPAGSYNKELVIPENKDFSINMKLTSNFIILKSVQGDVQYQKGLSSQEKGIFLFHSGAKDSKIRFQEFDLSGALTKNLNYYIRIKPSVKEENFSAVHSSSSSVPVISSQENTNIIPAGNTNMSSIIIASIEGLSPGEALSELDKMISSTNINDEDRELIRYKKTDILISQGRFNEADREIGNLKNQYKKYYYMGKLLSERKNYKEALRNFMDALGGDDDTKKATILAMEKLVLAMGVAEKNLLDRLKSETNRYKNDKEFYVNSMLGIARIYQYLPDVYSAKDIYEMILNGDYDENLKNKTRHSYDELKKEFLEYR